MLRLEDLKKMEPNKIFISGHAFDTPSGIHMLGTGDELKWVAVRGGIHDWAIYCHKSHNTEDYIKDYGNKVHDPNTIRRLVECDDEAFKMYRH